MSTTPTDNELFERIRNAEEQVNRGFEAAMETLDGLRCVFCHIRFTPEEIDDPDATYIEVRSWVTGPKLQSPVLRDHSGRRAHTSCIQKLIDGESPDQEAIPGMEE